MNDSPIPPHVASTARLWIACQDEPDGTSVDELLASAEEVVLDSRPEFFFALGPLKPNDLRKYVGVALRGLRHRRLARLVVVNDGLGQYLEADWRLARVVHERGVNGLMLPLFTALWWMRRLTIALCVRAGFVLEVDPWLDMMSTIQTNPGAANGAVRVVVAQPLVEDFKLSTDQAAQVEALVRSSNASFVLPHPRSPETYGLPVLERVKGEAAELAVLRCGGVAVGFCSSTQYNLSAMGVPVEFLNAPESIPTLAEHRRKLDEASLQRTTQFEAA